MKKYTILLFAVLMLLAVACIPTLASATTKYVTLEDGPGHVVNVRSEASLSGNVLTTLTYGSTVDVTFTRGDWSHVEFYDYVKHKEFDGFIKSEYLTSTRPTNAEWLYRYGTSTLSQSDTYNSYVWRLQNDLNFFATKNGDYYLNWFLLDVDGRYGSNTIDAVKYAQMEFRLDEDGICGYMTKEYLFKWMKQKGYITAPDDPTPYYPTDESIYDF